MSPFISSYFLSLSIFPSVKPRPLNLSNWRRKRRNSSPQSIYPLTAHDIKVGEIKGEEQIWEARVAMFETKREEWGPPHGGREEDGGTVDTHAKMAWVQGRLTGCSPGPRHFPIHWFNYCSCLLPCSGPGHCPRALPLATTRGQYGHFCDDIRFFFF